ncbi:mycofactocin-coupled SDR family oxidoreductase [Rhodococcus sp. A14]|uniref:mycofactocin-coupled SDR family oxidoreductase n=1 Tax=Rhodococcus sp. A14 TaxID=1194106 RepID=UPI001422E745|nr:mycofactocin-coupled SDR family oxidoreductase [Rhodococcus sp. A14]
MGLFDDKVVFITGAARGQGRSHALRFAREGADVIAVDIARDAIESVEYELATESELDAVITEIESLGRRAVRGMADVRSLAAMRAVVDEGLSRFGKIDIVVANAGIGTYSRVWEMSDQVWRDTIDTNLTGVWNATRAALPSMVERGEGGAVVLTSSTAGLAGYQNTAHYTAAKHGVIGLTKVLAQELGVHKIRANAVCPTAVNTKLIVNDVTFSLFAPGVEKPGVEDVREAFAALNVLPDLPWIEPEDVTEAVIWLASDAARYVTGVAMPVDGGNLVKTW